MTDEVTRIVDKLRTEANIIRSGIQDAADEVTHHMNLLRAGVAARNDALALALENGGGCAECHGAGEIYDGYRSRAPLACAVCSGSGISDAMRPLLAACGVQHG